MEQRRWTVQQVYHPQKGPWTSWLPFGPAAEPLELPPLISHLPPTMDLRERLGVADRLIQQWATQALGELYKPGFVGRRG
jgi:hypothetical protein